MQFRNIKNSTSPTTQLSVWNRCAKLVFVLIVSALLLPGCQAAQNGKQGTLNRLFGNKDNRPDQVDSDELLDPLGKRNTNRLVLADFAPSQIGTTLAAQKRGNNEEKANAAFQKGNQLYQQALAKMDANPTSTSHRKEFVDAAGQFRIAAANWSDSALEQDALFFEGESFFFADHYVQANRAFEGLISRYSGTRYLDKAEARRFAIAQYWLEKARDSNRWTPNIAFNDPSRPTMNMKGEAKRILHRIRVDDPTGKLADDATMALGNAYFENGDYYDAASTYEDLRTNYPSSKHAFHATLFELKSRMQSYQGESYDAEPLEKADELLKTLVTRFPKESSEEEEYLRQEAGAVRNLLAQRGYTLGEYYERRGENRAAQMLYQQVAKEYDDTNFSDPVQERLAQLKGKPAEPEQYAKWLVDAFSEADEGPIASAAQSQLDTIIR